MSKAEVIKPVDMIVRTGELAAIIGKSDRWIRQLTTDGILTQVSRGKYVLGDAVQDYAKHITGEVEDNDKPKLVEHRTEHMRIKAEMAALELEELRGNLHHTSDITEVWGELLVEFRKLILVLPPKMAGELAYMSDAKSIRDLLTSELTATLRLLAQYDPEKGDGDDATKTANS